MRLELGEELELVASELRQAELDALEDDESPAFIPDGELVSVLVEAEAGDDVFVLGLSRVVAAQHLVESPLRVGVCGIQH